uniref:C2H2-type domain-containing protein n=1 Tax=Acrobeloides nanus TaxID=290746 RepID=A0A914DDS3_9BILA
MNQIPSANKALEHILQVSMSNSNLPVQHQNGGLQIVDLLTSMTNGDQQVQDGLHAKLENGMDFTAEQSTSDEMHRYERRLLRVLLPALAGFQAIPIRLKILFDRLFSELSEEEDVEQILQKTGWTLIDYNRGYILKDRNTGEPLTTWNCNNIATELQLMQAVALHFPEHAALAQSLRQSAIHSLVYNWMASAAASAAAASAAAAVVVSNDHAQNERENLEQMSRADLQNVPTPPKICIETSIEILGGSMNGEEENGLEQVLPKSTATSPRIDSKSETKIENNVLELLANASLQSIEAQNGTSSGVSDAQTPPRNLYSSMESTSSALSPISSGTPTEMPVLQSPNLQSRGSKSEENGLKNKFNRNLKNIKKRVQCVTCLKTFCDKGALKIHNSAVHLKEMHRCTIPGCDKMFSSRRSRNRHSGNPAMHTELGRKRNCRSSFSQPQTQPLLQNFPCSPSKLPLSVTIPGLMTPTQNSVFPALSPISSPDANMFSMISKALAAKIGSPSQLLALEKFRSLTRNPEVSPLDLTGVMKREQEMKVEEGGMMTSPQNSHTNAQLMMNSTGMNPLDVQEFLRLIQRQASHLMPETSVPQGIQESPPIRNLTLTS